MDCSLMQCCQEMLDADLFATRNATGARWAPVFHPLNIFHLPRTAHAP